MVSRLTVTITDIMAERLTQVSVKYGWPKSRIIDLALRISLKKIEEILKE